MRKLTILAAIVLAGCAYSKPGGDYAAYRSDYAACRESSQMMAGAFGAIGGVLFASSDAKTRLDACMEAKGYTPNND